MTEQQKVKLFETELEYIKHDDIRQFIKIAIENFKNYFFEVSASSSGRYHSELENGYGGLVYHTKSVAKIGNYLVNLEQYKTKLREREGDIVIASCITHDCLKHGLENKTGYSVFEHPQIAKEWLESAKELDDIIPEEDRKAIARAVWSHSGQWNTSKRSKIILAKPENLVQELVHLSDYIASRADIHILFDDAETKPELPDPHTYKMDFGKQYFGMLLPELVGKHSDYIQWMRDQGIRKEPLMTLIKILEKEQKDKI